LLPLHKAGAMCPLSPHTESFLFTLTLRPQPSGPWVTSQTTHYSMLPPLHLTTWKTEMRGNEHSNVYNTNTSVLQDTQNKHV